MELNDALIRSCKYGHIELLKIYIKEKADVFANNNEPIRTACINGHLHIVKYLIEVEGVPFFLEKNLLLTLAIENKHHEIVRYLIGLLHKMITANL